MNQRPFNASEKLLLSCRTLVDEIDDVHIRNTRIRLESDLAGSAVRIAHLDVVRLNLWTQFTQAVLVEFWECESSVASESAAAYALRQINVVRTHLGECNQIIGYTHLARRTGKM